MAVPEPATMGLLGRAGDDGFAGDRGIGAGLVEAEELKPSGVGTPFALLSRSARRSGPL